MRLLLLYPPTAHMIRTNVPRAVEETTGCYPPLGLLYVAAAVEREGRHEVVVTDTVAEGLREEQIRRQIRDVRPDVVGIQALTFTLMDVRAVARLCKEEYPQLPVVLGGPHPHLFPELTLTWPEVDHVLLGEGENNIVPFLDTLSARGDLTRVPGWVGRAADGGIARGPPNPLVENLDVLPIPARHLVNPTRYRSVLGRGQRLTTIISSRGCPARCLFCARPHLGKRFRARSASSVVSEMELCQERFGVDEFFFYDDTFTIDRERVLEICREVRRRHLSAFWDIRARVSDVDREMLDALRSAGCVRIHFGIESGNEQVLRTIRKGISLDEARQVLRWSREAGLETLAYFMIGFPGEGPTEVQDTIAYALSLDCDYVHVSVTTPFPGTELYRLGLERGVYPHDVWAEYARNPTPDFVPPVWEERFAREELIRYAQELYRRFYFRPRYVWNRLRRIHSCRELCAKAAAGIRLFLGGKSW